MNKASEAKTLQEPVERLSALVGVPARKARVRKKLRPRNRAGQADAVLDVGPFIFVLEIKSSGSVVPVATAAEQVQMFARTLGPKAIPLVVVPYMGDAGRQRCEELGVGWFDLSGNARIVAPGLHVVIEGKPNRFKRSGRPSSAFAPKSSRVVRWLLMHPNKSMTQRELANATGVDEGFISRIVGKLQEDDLLVREPGGALRARNPGALLDAWRESYDFTKHRILQGHIAARSGEELLQRIAEDLHERRVSYAATGLAAAWLYTQFAGFRIVTIYLKSRPTGSLLESLSFREEPRGANLWLIVPKDEGVLQGTTEIEGVRCVHPVQAYVDLKAHPERAAEAAERLRQECLSPRA